MYRTLSFVALSCRYFDLNQGAKVGAMPEHSDYFCNEELGQKTKTWVQQNLVGGALATPFPCRAAPKTIGFAIIDE